MALLLHPLLLPIIKIHLRIRIEGWEMVQQRRIMRQADKHVRIGIKVLLHFLSRHNGKRRILIRRMLMSGEPVERRAVWVAGHVAALEAGVLRVVIGEKRTGTGRGVKRSLHRDIVILGIAKSCFGHRIRQWHLLAWSKVSSEVADVPAQE